MSRINRYFGIDFGTTNSAMVGIIKTREGKSHVRYSDEVGGPFPSLIAIDNITGEIYCGREVWQKRRELEQSCEIIKSVKSHLGTNKTWNIAGQTWTPEHVATQLFKGLKKNASSRFNTYVNEAVVSIPVGFSSEKRKILRKAAKNAGIEIQSFVSESTAAVFKNYDLLKRFSKVAIFDWGGGTLDVSVVELNDYNIFELSVSGAQIGGDDIDVSLAQWAHNKTAIKKNIDISFNDMDPSAQDELIYQAEQAKRNLSDDDSTAITSLKYGELGKVFVQLDFDTFTELIEPFINKAILTLEEAVKKSGLSIQQIDCILMVGGSSNLKPLLEKIEKKWKNHIEFPDGVEWSIAEGASLLSLNPGNFKLNQDIGIILSDDSFYPIKIKNQNVPTEPEILEFGIVEDSNVAKFIFSERNEEIKTSVSRTLGYINVPAYGFGNEKIILSAHIDDNLVFKASLKSNHRTKQNTRTFEIPDIKFYYEIPKQDV